MKFQPIFSSIGLIIMDLKMIIPTISNQERTAKWNLFIIDHGFLNNSILDQNYSPLLEMKKWTFLKEKISKQLMCLPFTLLLMTNVISKKFNTLNEFDITELFKFRMCISFYSNQFSS